MLLAKKGTIRPSTALRARISSVGQHGGRGSAEVGNPRAILAARVFGAPSCPALSFDKRDETNRLFFRLGQVPFFNRTFVPIATKTLQLWLQSSVYLKTLVVLAAVGYS